VATPLGNLGDLSQRAIELLATADAVYCEDTRHSRTLFTVNDIATAGRLHALHEHNEASQCAEICDRVARGEHVVLISDAGTPGISDPGARVVAAVAQAGLVVTTAPGPSAVIAALSISGLPTERFCMEGFVPRKAGERQALYETWANEPRTVVFYESPQRITVTIRELAERFPSRRVAIAREITKLHEEVLRGTLESVADVLENREVLGEIVAVLEGVNAAPGTSEAAVRAALADQLRHGASVKDAVAEVVAALHVSHRETYELALEVRASL
jgi:16S rRNA (cytidine1402-2'-O)-methyltransferase